MIDEATAISSKAIFYINRLQRLQNNLIYDLIMSGQLNDIIRKIIDTKNKNSKIFACGNGGSAATATHFVCDLNKLLSIDASTLHDNISTLMALSNDISYEDALAETAKIKMNRGDLLFVFTGSGNSKNVLKLLRHAKNLGYEIFLFTGFDGGAASSIIDSDNHIHIHIDENHMGRVEDCHMMICHLICYIIKDLTGV